MGAEHSQNLCGRLISSRVGGINTFLPCVLLNGHEGTCKDINQVPKE